jgi:hypothetical protein
MGTAIILAAQDGDATTAEVNALLQGYNTPGAPPVIAIVPEPLNPPPPVWDPVVVLYILSRDSMADPNLISHATTMADLGFPVVPVVPDLATFRFDTLPESLDLLLSRNAMAVTPPAELARLCESVEGNLGLGAFVQDRAVFISYRRSDAEAVAREIEDYLWTQRCVPFLDTIQIAGGQVVQPRVMEALHQKDFVLFIDSPDAANSDWVRAEILEAFARRIPACSVRVNTPGGNTDLLDRRPSMVWNAANPNRLAHVLQLISRGIAARGSLDSRVSRTLDELARTGITPQQIGNRQYRLTAGRRSVLVEYEDARIGLESLHRLSASFTGAGSVQRALYVCGDYKVLPITSDAVRWARGQQPLEVVTLADLVAEVSEFLGRGSTKGTTFGRCLGQQTITTTGLPTRTSPRSCYPVAGLFEPRRSWASRGAGDDRHGAAAWQVGVPLGQST